MVVQGRLTVLAWGSDPLEPPGRRWRLAGKPAGPIARAGPGEPRRTGHGAGEGAPGGGPDWTTKDVLSRCPAAPVTTTT